MNDPVQINFVVALSAEALPVIKYFKLKRVHDISVFEVYRKDNVQLIISGIGKQNAAVAVGYLAGISETDSIQAWLNAGIAGGEAAKLGEAVLANVIRDEESGYTYYPSICFDTEITQTKIATINKPAENYRDDALYDMEASGYYAAASRFSPSELVHCCKIVSDNTDQGIDHINKESVTAMIDDQIDVIVKLGQELAKLGAQLVPEENIEKIFSSLTGQFHFTTTQKNRLKILLQNWFAICKHIDLSQISSESIKNASECLAALDRYVNNCQIRY